MALLNPDGEGETTEVIDARFEAWSIACQVGNLYEVVQAIAGKVAEDCATTGSESLSRCREGQSRAG
jgi:hypothetical protein